MAHPIFSFYFFFFLFPSLFSSLDPPFCNHHDYSALLQFKNSFSLNSYASEGCVGYQSSYPKTASWGNVSNCCLWDGVTCNSMLGHVIGLDLSCSWLQGQFHPNNTFFQLPHLQTLNLAFNDFNRSSISSQFGDLVTLTHLNLSSSVFANEIPSKISQLSKLVSLDLSWNEFEYSFGRRSSFILEPSTWKKVMLNITDLRELVLDGINMSSITPSSLSLLMNLSSSLVSLRLQDTELQGNITNVIPCLQNLQKLDLSKNENLKAQLPKSNWSSPLKYLDLSYTAFSGEVPTFKPLNFLSLGGCQFEGPIPPRFKNLTQLTYLNLCLNNFNGEISFLSNLEHLIYLDLSYNYFTGEIPYVFIKLSKLKFLSLSQNKLQGNFPESIFGLINLSSLILSSNNFSGLVNFHQFSKFQNLVRLGLSNNKFLSFSFDNNVNYTIPNLRLLVLSSCNINGFPKLLDPFPNLIYLNLFDNKLQGNFPESIFGLTKLYSLILSSNNLSGLVNFHQFSKLQNLETLDLSNNKFLSLSSDNNVSYTIPNLRYLELSSCNINGFPNLLGNLPNLKDLNLSNNRIHGRIPKWFKNVGNDSLQYLDLSHNNLTSVEHLSMRNIRFLDLSFNMLQGNLPIPFFGVTFFSTSNNKLSGHISSLFCNASSLVVLNLSHNNLSGLIPQCLVAFPYLSALDLQMNNLVGTIPNNFSKSNSLQSLHFDENQLEGPLPRSLAHCNQLEILDVGVNKIKDVFPNWLEGLPGLQVLVLRDNKFYGAISNSNTKHPFSMLRIFDVSNNHFNGSFPTVYIREFKRMMKIDYGTVGLQYMINKNYSFYKDSVMVTVKNHIIELQSILTTLTIIDLSKNMFNGEIPKVIGELESLIGLNLSHNRINGSIPQSMGNLKSLEWLDLSSNKLMGEIPLTLTNLNFLAILNLSQNQLVGVIPKGKQFDTFPIDFYEGNLGLCGFPLSNTCNKDEEELPQPSSSTNEEFGFGWKPVALGYGCGMVFGMLMGCVVFLIGKPQWILRTFDGEPKKRAKRTGNRTHAKRGRMN